MSLINQVLKDLERKPHQRALSESLLRGIQTQFASRLTKRKKYYFLAATVSGVVLATAIGSLIETLTTSTAQPAVTKAVVNSPMLLLKAPATDTAIVANSSAMLTGIALQMQHDMTYLRFLLNHNVLYQVSSDVDKHELTLIFEHTQLVAALPKINYSNSGIENITAFKDENGNLKLVVALSPTTDIKHLSLGENEKTPELQLDLRYGVVDNVASQANAFINTATTMPVTIKKPIAGNAKEEDYQVALQQITAGNIAQAILTLKNLVTVAPSYMKARLSLASLLIQTDAKSDAMAVINTGLKIEKTNSELLKLKARLLVEANHLEVALALLEKFTPQLAEDPDYYAFLAALYQRQERPALAAALYKKLLTLQPSNAKWWVGLGIASESLGDQNQATDAFTSAENIGGLDPELKSYLMTRLHSA